MEKINFSQSAMKSEEEVRELIGQPHELVVNKSISFLDEHCQKFICMSPIVFLSTSNAEGKCDVSPRGDLPGTISILNRHQLVIPDRPGNKRLDSILNILSNPNIGLVFLIPGLEEVLRINGRATIIKDKEILNKMNVKGKTPLLGIGIDVEECYIHCPRALKESGVWNISTWSESGDLPSMMEVFTAHLKINGIQLKAETL